MRRTRHDRLPFALGGAALVSVYAVVVAMLGGSSSHGAASRPRRQLGDAAANATTNSAVVANFTGSVTAPSSLLGADNSTYTPAYLTAGGTTEAAAANDNNKQNASGELSLISALEGSSECNTPFDLNGGVLIFAFVTFYTFIGLAIVCDDYFCPSLEIISEALSLSEDVAGATFMAAGSSAPELFTALVTIFVAPGDQGVGTIVGSAVFNLCVIVGLSCLCAGAVLDLFWWPLTRDSAVYFVSIVCMMGFMADGLITAVEAAIMTLLYFVYLGIMIANPRIVRWIKGEVGPGGGGGSGGVVEMSAPSEDPRHLTPERKSTTRGDGSEDGAGAHGGGLEQGSPAGNGGALGSPGSDNGNGNGNGNGGAPGGERAAADAGEEEEGGGGVCSKAYAVLAKPMGLALAYTIPDCQEAKWAKYYFVTFTMSIVWIGLLSFIMVDFASRAACVLGVSELVIGLVVLSVGTSVPDALSSVIVAKQGQGNMAVCNALGSNIFNILLGLGLPWWVKVAMDDGEPYPVPDFAAIGEPLSLLLLYLLLFIGILKFGNWKLSPNVGWALLGCQLVYTTWTLLRHLPSDHPIINL